MSVQLFCVLTLVFPIIRVQFMCTIKSLLPFSMNFHYKEEEMHNLSKNK